MNYRSNTFIGLSLAASLVTSMLLTTPLQADQDEGGWKVAGEVYLWGAGIGGTTSAGDDIDISFDDIIENLDMAAMATIVAEKDKWRLFGDFVYLDIEDDTSSTANLIGYQIKTSIDVELQGFIATLGGNYRIYESEQNELGVVAGARYLWLDVDADYDIGASTEHYSESGHIWDGIVGLRGTTDLSDKWYITYYADVGTGDSETTWQAKADFNYRFEKVHAVFGYRYLDWNFDDNDTFDDLNISGPYAGVKFKF